MFYKIIILTLTDLTLKYNLLFSHFILFTLTINTAPDFDTKRWLQLVLQASESVLRGALPPGKQEIKHGKIYHLA